MNQLELKNLLLISHGYRYSLKRHLFVNKDLRKFISEYRLRDSLFWEGNLTKILREPIDEQCWVFYSIYRLPEKVMKELLLTFDIDPNSKVKNDYTSRFYFK